MRPWCAPLLPSLALSHSVLHAHPHPHPGPRTPTPGTLTKAADVYSFGVIMWECYTGQPPFIHNLGFGFTRNAAFPTLPPNTPPTFAAVTAACLNPLPDERPTFLQVCVCRTSCRACLPACLPDTCGMLCRDWQQHHACTKPAA